MSNRGFYICNPATRQCITLPLNLVGANVVALYRHSSSGEYRVLYRNWIDLYPDVAYYVLTVGSYAEPRCIGLPTAAAPALVKQYIAAGQLFVTERPPVFLHSCLHWIVYSARVNALVVFDTVAESFRCMCPPTAENGLWRHLHELDDTLGMSYIDERKMMVKLWVLQDYEMEVWSLKYKIELPMAELRSIDKNCSFKVSVVLGNGDVLVSCSRLCHLYHCDNMGKLLQKFRWHCVFSRPIGHCFKESLVRHAFFQGQDNYHVVKPIFQWS
ncbi:unnamed protein product [Urochloa decumbens]|uniref:F-box associated beta-propeller type 3 domain-containing protein n=1 Tax=Urochloa decumbens TaxID=240449 RepID=A0ABC9A177_9POAL